MFWISAFEARKKGTSPCFGVGSREWIVRIAQDSPQIGQVGIGGELGRRLS
jgi:hypothetical protein